MMQRTPTASRRLPALATLLAGLVLAACSHMPATETPAAASDAPPAHAADAVATPQTEAAGQSSMVTVATVTMSCVPTKDAQALGLHQTEQVEASYQQPANDDAGDSSVALSFDGKTYRLRQAPSASGSRYVTSDALAPGHKGFSWHTKRNEAIISALEAGSGVNNVVDGPLLYRCLAIN